MSNTAQDLISKTTDAITPAAPVAEREAEVGFSSAGHRLTGTLLTPTTNRAPVALLISGSGPIDRNSNTKRAGVDVMRQVAEHLASAGIGSLRYDKRGVGASGGNYLTTGLYDNVADAEAALALLRREAECPSGPVVVVGHSEGALIAAELAAADPTIAGVVLLAGAARSGEDIVWWQSEQITRSMPAPLRALLLGRQRRRVRRLIASTGDTTGPFFARANARWHREFLAHDPTRSLQQIAIPVLAVTGEKDIQVDPDDVARIGRLVTGPFTGSNPADLTHLLRTDHGRASIWTYKRQAKRPVDPDLLALTAQWIHDLADAGRPR